MTRRESRLTLERWGVVGENARLTGVFTSRLDGKAEAASGFENRDDG